MKVNNLLSDEKRINTGIRKNCPLSLTLLDTYKNESIELWNKIFKSEITIKKFNKTKHFTLC